MSEQINHPAHYGGDTTYETIKVIEAWQLGFRLGNCVKYLSRAGRKGDRLEDLRKAQWYLAREVRAAELEEGGAVLEAPAEAVPAAFGELIAMIKRITDGPLALHVNLDQKEELRALALRAEADQAVLRLSRS